MITIKKAALDDDTVARLIGLSQRWEEENCTFGLRANTREDLREPCYVALEEGRIIGYAFGHFYTREQALSCIPGGSRCFELDELYILPDYRSRGLGRQLFRALEAEVKAEADFLTLSTATKDYRRVLRFYAEENDMTFHDAFLFKPMHGA